MKHLLSTRFFTFALLLGAFGSIIPEAAAVSSREMWARKILHNDGTHTISRKNPIKNTLVEETYGSTQSLVTRRIFQMDSKGRIRNGLIFDGNKNLLGRTEYGFDKRDRIKVERLWNAQGQVVRDLVYRYNPDGTLGKPVAYTYDADRPNAAPRKTTVGDIEPILPAARNEADYPGLPIGNAEATKRSDPIGIGPLRATGQSQTQATPPEKKKRKPGLIKRLFNGFKKD